MVFLYAKGKLAKVPSINSIGGALSEDCIGLGHVNAMKDCHRFV